MKKKGFRLGGIAALLALFGTIIYGLWMELDGYSSSTTTFPQEGYVSSSIEPPELSHALAQEYAFLGDGNQCFAYVSRDGKYVLKLFKERFHFPHSWIIKWPRAEHAFPYLQEKKRLADFKFHRAFAGYLLAGSTLWNETGLLYLHLAPTEGMHTTVYLTDRLGISHEVLLDDVPFLLQKKATLASTYLAQLAKQGNKEKREDALASILDLIQKRVQCRVHDEDFNPRKNLGFVDGKAIFFDPGRFTPPPPGFDAERESAELEAKIQAWVDQRTRASQ